MKKLLLTLFCLFAMFTVKAQCDYNIDLNDSWGDGWSSVTLDVIVDGVVVLDDISCSASSNTFPFTVNDGSTISIVWNGVETYTNEISFSMRDFLNDAVIASGAYGSTPDIPDALCVVPSCEDASATMSDITTTGAKASWAAANGAASYDWEVVPSGSAQGVGVVASGSGETGLTVSISGLSSATDYDFLISSDCTSDYSSAVSFTTNPGCGDTVVVCYDNGTNKLAELESSGNYVTVTFNEGDIETCCDAIFVYDSLDQTGNVLYTGTGDVTGETATSTTGIISVWMAADGSYSCTDGFGGPYTPISMTLTCAVPPSCFTPNTLAISNIAADGAQVDFVSGNPTPSGNYEYELVNTTNGEVADGSTDGTATTNPFTLSGLVENASYEIYIKEICGVGDESDFSSAATWTQLLNAPGCASNFSPVDGATQVNTNVVFTLDAPTTGGTAADYTFFLGTDPAALSNIGTVAGTSVSISGLFLSTTYYWQVIPNNAIGSATGCVINQFTTKTPPSGPDGLTCPLGDESTSQYTESFDAQGDWTGDFGSSNDTWKFTTTTTVSGDTGPSAGQDGSYIYFEASGANTNSGAIVSPLIDLTTIDAGDDAELTFYMHAYGQGMGTLEVGASTSQTGPFTNLLTWDGQIQITSAADWLQVGLDISGYTGGNLYIEFKQTGATDYRGDMSIDTMEVVACTEIPSCQIPNTLTATVSSGGATTIDWVDPNDPAEEDFDYELLDVTAGETATGVPTGQVTTNSLDLTSLVDGNDYSILVRTACSRGGLSGEIYSDWSPAFSWNQTELPGCATNLSPAEGETVSTGTTVTFTWDAPITGGTATSYDLYYGLNGAVADQFLANYTVQTATVNGFPIGNHNYLVVAKNAGGSAVSCTSINFTTAPIINDACGGAIDLDTLTSPLTSTTAGASNDYTGGDCLTNSASPDLFYSVTVPAGYTLSIEQTSNAYDSKVRLAYGTSCPGDIVIACQDDLDTDVLTWLNNTGSEVEVYYVQSAYSTGSGAFVLAWSITAPPGCGDTVYDTGGASGDYSSNEDYTRTYTPDTPGDLVTLDFTIVDLENCCDTLRIYDGADTSATLLNGDIETPQSFTSSTDAGLTIRFTSDGSVTRAGWAATISCFTPCNWTGTTSSDWATATNWSTGAVPTSSDNVYIDGTFTNEPSISSTDAVAGSVTVATSNTLIIDETSSLTVSGDFTNTGTVTLNSTADDYSSLIVTGTASGDIVYNRYVNVYDDTLGGGWDLVCSPVGMSIADFITANGSNIQVLGDDYAFSQFNNATGQWERYATASQTGNFEAGKGYSMATTGGSTVAFTGTMQTADQSINIINNNGLNGVGRRWNLVSNPFPSYISGNTAAGTNNFMDANSAVIDSEFLAVYGWNGSEYTIYNQLSGAFSMAPGQGFWVAALNTTDTALNFTAAMRTTTGTGDFVSSPQLLTYNVAVKLYNGETEKATTDFYFRDGLSLDLDPGYDAAAFNQSMALSTRLPQGSQETAFGINAMGMDAMQNTRVPLEIRQNAGQAFRVSIADMDLPEDIYVYLEDTLNGTLTSLKDGDFELVAQSNLSGSDRFFIVFKSNSVLSNDDTLGINALNVYKANTDSFVTIAGISPELGKLNVSLYNILGQTVREKALSSATATQRVSTQGLASGLYIVQIRSGNQTTVKKIIVK